MTETEKKLINKLSTTSGYAAQLGTQCTDMIRSLAIGQSSAADLDLDMLAVNLGGLIDLVTSMKNIQEAAR